MLRTLAPHADSPCAALSAIEVRVTRSGDRLELAYAALGRIADLRLPAPAQPERADGLWRSTCFEAFVAGAHGGGYYELNFAPSGRWAAYAFDGYRAGMRPAEAAPDIAVETGPARLALTARLDLAGLAGLAAAPWRLGLSAVIEDAAGARSFWALAHPPGPPDFHHADGFVLQLPATETS